MNTLLLYVHDLILPTFRLCLPFTLFCLRFTLTGFSWVSVLLAFLKLISLSLAGFTSLLDVWIHIFVLEVQHLSFFPILTHTSTLNISAAAWLQHDPNLNKTFFVR